MASLRCAQIAQRAVLSWEALIPARPVEVVGPVDRQKLGFDHALYEEARTDRNLAEGHAACVGPQIENEKPPSTGIAVPVTKSDAGLARKIAMPAKSSGVPQRPAGTRPKILSLTDGVSK